MGQAIEHGGGHLGVVEHFRPIGEGEIVVINSEAYSATVFSVTLSGSSILCAAVSRAVITEAPHKRESRRGRIPREHLAL